MSDRTVLPSADDAHGLLPDEMEAEANRLNPLAAAFVREHSAVFLTALQDDPSVAWTSVLPPAPTLAALVRVMKMLEMLQRLQTERPTLDPFRICHIRSRPLFDCLADTSPADLADMVDLAEYLQLPKALVRAVQEHREALGQLGVCQAVDATRAAGTAVPSLWDVLRESALLGQLFMDAVSVGPMLTQATPADRRTLVLESRASTGGVTWPVGGVGGEAAILRYVWGLCGVAVPRTFTLDSSTRLDADAYEAAAARVAGLLVAGHARSFVEHLGRSIKRSHIPVAAVAAKGDLETLQWLRAEGWRFDCSRVAAHAASTGQLRVLEYVLPEVTARGVQRYVLRAAVAGGSLPVLQLLVARGTGTDEALVDAVRGGRLAMVHWLVDEHKLPVASRGANPCAVAAERGDLPLLRFLAAREYRLDAHVCGKAACGGHLDVLRWLRAQVPPCPLDDTTCFWAAAQGHLEVLQWALSQEPACPLSGHEMDMAAQGGHVPVIEFLMELGQPLDEDTCAAALKGGQLDTLKWLRSQDPPCPWDEDSVGPEALDNVFLYRDVSDGEWAALRTWLAANTPYYSTAATEP